MHEARGRQMTPSILCVIFVESTKVTLKLASFQIEATLKFRSTFAAIRNGSATHGATAGVASVGTHRIAIDIDFVDRSDDIFEHHAEDGVVLESLFGARSFGKTDSAANIVGDFCVVFEGDIESAFQIATIMTSAVASVALRNRGAHHKLRDGMCATKATNKSFSYIRSNAACLITAN